MNTDESRIEQGSRDYDRLVEKLRPIYYSVKSDEYNKILTALCSQNLDSIVDVLLSVYQDRKEMKMELIRMRGELREAEFEKIVNVRLLDDYRKQLSESQRSERTLSCKLFGMTSEDGAEMQYLYEQGMSLRKLAEKYKCDKATVKRRLIKLGATIRERE